VEREVEYGREKKWRKNWRRKWRRWSIRRVSGEKRDGE
jgi:hypothetical protein